MICISVKYSIVTGGLPIINFIGLVLLVIPDTIYKQILEASDAEKALLTKMAWVNNCTDRLTKLPPPSIIDENLVSARLVCTIASGIFVVVPMMVVCCYPGMMGLVRMNG